MGEIHALAKYISVNASSPPTWVRLSLLIFTSLDNMIEFTKVWAPKSFGCFFYCNQNFVSIYATGNNMYHFKVKWHHNCKQALPLLINTDQTVVWFESVSSGKLIILSSACKYSKTFCE